MGQVNEPTLKNKEELFSAENALNSDFCDTLVAQLHKNILGEKLSKEIYESYFVLFDRQYKTEEIQYLIEILEMQANEIIRSRSSYSTLCGVLLTVLGGIIAMINSKFFSGITDMQIFIVIFLSFNIAVLCISYIVEREYKKVNEVIRLLKYYLIFYR